MIKIDIITGFLGAGKTTLMSRVLQSTLFRNEKVVIIENEFGEMSIDADILREDDVNVFDISHGCICCTLKKDFLGTLQKICDDIKPDRILIEPSGIFVLQDLRDLVKHESLSGKCDINNIITVVDGPFLLNPRSKGLMFVSNQISGATKLIVSKCDDMSEEQIKELQLRVKDINKEAPLLIKKWHELCVQDYIELFSQSTEGEPIRDDLAFEHLKEADIKSFTLVSHEAKTEEEVRDFMALVMENTLGQVLRLKGYIKSESGRWLINYVNGLYVLEHQDIEDDTRLNVIGTDLNKEKISHKIS